jgi:hypothetical protein
MKIKIENFGPIHSFEMDLDKDLHLLYGENNVGKSYAISLVFLILRKLEAIREVFDQDGIYSIEGKAIPTMESLGENLTDVTDILMRAIKNTMNESFIPGLVGAMISTRGDSSVWTNRLNSENAHIILTFDSFSIQIRPDEQRLLIVESVAMKMEYVLGASILGSLNEKQIALWWVAGELGDPPFLFSSHPHLLPSTELSLGASREAFYLPAARSGIYSGLSGLSFIFAKLSQIRHLLAGERIELPYLPEPSSDFFLRVSAINGKEKTELADLVSSMERELIQGEVHFDTLTKRLKYFQPSIGITFDLEQTSSMVAELVIVIAFLKFILDPRTVKNEHKREQLNYRRFATLFIEEPEAHLHPAVQVKLTEYLVKLSKLGVKVIITTHSNYMFNKASNLILKGELEEAKFANYHMIMTEKGSILNPKDTLHDWGIEDENFVAVAQELYQERLKAIEQD